MARVGDAIDLQGDDTSTQVEVTLVKVVDPDSSNDGFSEPPAGDRYVSLQFKILNRGSSTYQDDRLVEISATGSSGQSMQQDFLTSTSAGLQLPSSVNLTSGGTSLGYVTFDVPKGDFVAQVQYQVSFLGNVDQWQVKSSLQRKRGTDMATHHPSPAGDRTWSTDPAAPARRLGRAVRDGRRGACSPGSSSPSTSRLDREHV